MVVIPSHQDTTTEEAEEVTEDEEVVEEEETEGEYGTRQEEPIAEMTGMEVTEEVTDQVVVDGVETVTVEDGEVEVVVEDVTMELLCPLITGGRKMVPVTDTMEEAEDMVDVVVEEEEEMTGEEVVDPLLRRTGLSLHPGTKGWRKNCSDLATGLLASILTGTRISL